MRDNQADASRWLARIGQKACDSVTGVQGTVTAVAFYYASEPRFQLEYLDGEAKSASDWFDVARMRAVSQPAI